MPFIEPSDCILCLSQSCRHISIYLSAFFALPVTRFSGERLSHEEVVNKLDALFMNEVQSDEISRTFFVNHLRQLFESSTVDEQLRDRVAHFLDSVDLFLELLYCVRALPEGEEFADDRVIATVSFTLRRIFPVLTTGCSYA